MRVLHLYSGNLFGGIETLLTTMARYRHLAPTMIPEFGLCFQGRLWDELVATGVTVHDLSAVRLSRPGTVARARRRLKRLLAVISPDVVATHDFWPHTVFAPQVRHARYRLVNFLHGAATGKHWLERRARRTTPDLVVANSRFTALTANNVFRDTPTTSWHLPVASPAVDRAIRSDVRSTLATSGDAVVILQASRLEHWKGHAILIKALERLREMPGWECWFAGGPQKTGEERFYAKLHQATVRAGLAGRVRFLGQRDDVSKLMAAADILCQPNTAPEPFGVALVEALYARLPVVTSGCGGALEIVDDTCGLLTIPGDSISVAAALATLIRDPLKRCALGEAGPSRAALLCDPARQLNQVATLLHSVRGESCNPDRCVPLFEPGRHDVAAVDPNKGSLIAPSYV